jgi:hypothetical protein
VGQLKTKSVKENVELTLKRKAVNCVGLKSEKIVGAKYSVKPDRAQSVNKTSSYS